MSIAATKAALSAYLSTVPDIGTLTTTRVDHDEVPRELRGTTVPYWDLRISGTGDNAAGFGFSAGSGAVQVVYQTRLEGWLGIRGQQVNTGDWEALVDAVLLKLRQVNLPPTGLALRGLFGLQNLRSDGLGVVLVAADNGQYRAHHVVITFEVLVTEGVAI